MDFPWFLLQVPERKVYLFLLMKAQRPKNIVLELIGGLNLETFLEVWIILRPKYLFSSFPIFTSQIIKTIYSLVMIITSVLD